jgi:S-adenosylmethionine hydrolase
MKWRCTCILIALALGLPSCRPSWPPPERPEPERPDAAGRPKGGAEAPKVVERYMAREPSPGPGGSVVRRVRPEPERGGLLVLLTDFGDRDYYVGAVKGAAYRANPRVRVESITHHVAPFDVREGAVTLSLAAREYPRDAVFVAVVDPGVGDHQRAIALRTRAGRTYVAPDNGLLTLVAREEGIAEVRDITGFRPLERVPSKTFHARDLFVPTGALLAGGTPLRRVGPALDGIRKLALAEPAFEDGALKGMVVRVDRHGNVVTNIPRQLVDAARLARGDRLSITVGSRTFDAPLAAASADVAEGRALARLDSLGRVELAVRKGSLALRIGARPGKAVEIRRKELAAAAG